MDNKAIASEIWNQMKVFDKNLCMCMGVSGLTAINRGLQFKVSGLSFKGFVEVTLNGKDLYDVRFIKAVRKQNLEAKKVGLKMFNTTLETVSGFNDVFAEDLMPLLESVVENREGHVG